MQCGYQCYRNNDAIAIAIQRNHKCLRKTSNEIIIKENLIMHAYLNIAVINNLELQNMKQDKILISRTCFVECEKQLILF